MAFRCRFERFEYKVMPFELTNAPALFQVLINDTLHPCLDHFPCAYLDNIVVYSGMLHEHILHVQEILKQLQACRLLFRKKNANSTGNQLSFWSLLLGGDSFK